MVMEVVSTLAVSAAYLAVRGAARQAARKNEDAHRYPR